MEPTPPQLGDPVASTCDDAQGEHGRNHNVKAHGRKDVEKTEGIEHAGPRPVILPNRFEEALLLSWIAVYVWARLSHHRTDDCIGCHCKDQD